MVAGARLRRRPRCLTKFTNFSPPSNYPGWGTMVDSFNLPSMQVVVDTTHAKVLITGPLIINITGGMNDETNLVHNPICFILTLNDKAQVTHWEGYWDQSNDGMTTALGKVMARMKAT